MIMSNNHKGFGFKAVKGSNCGSTRNYSVKSLKAVTEISRS